MNFCLIKDAILIHAINSVHFKFFWWAIDQEHKQFWLRLETNKKPINVTREKQGLAWQKGGLLGVWATDHRSTPPYPFADGRIRNSMSPAATPKCKGRQTNKTIYFSQLRKLEKVVKIISLKRWGCVKKSWFSSVKRRHLAKKNKTNILIFDIERILKMESYVDMLLI